MNSIGSFLRKLRAKKEVADAGRKGAVTCSPKTAQN
jgi:hypothetical protein